MPDIKERRYTGRSWTYRMSIAGTLVSDAVAFGRDQFPYVTVEAVLPVGEQRARVRQRHELRLDRPQPGLPDYSDFISRGGARAQVSASSAASTSASVL